MLHLFKTKISGDADDEDGEGIFLHHYLSYASRFALSPMSMFAFEHDVEHNVKVCV